MKRLTRDSREVIAAVFSQSAKSSIVQEECLLLHLVYLPQAPKVGIQEGARKIRPASRPMALYQESAVPVRNLKWLAKVGA